MTISETSKDSSTALDGAPEIAYTIPGMAQDAGAQVVKNLQERLIALTDLHLTLKHVHWNVVGPNFIGVHEMLDPQVDSVREMADSVAERISAMGGSPVGTPGHLVAQRSWDDYSIGRAGTIQHLGALDLVYQGVIADYRAAIESVGELDPITEDMLIDHSTDLEQFHWFVRAHLENAGGEVSSSGASSEVQAAKQAGEKRFGE
ncbi:DNA starvation/stationary phase protection protein [uncultured Pseudokineococcus sp.]|uniref:Dps family protein n=1 Tax=uncultured Pseudokineococcus sp. TaxID=1642928 RepID=UPI0026309C1A|nr:DNA starvation/stationary phase protection protein [uncultured Pseudokineococcus sp.]